jgi:two-component SAPR family response regulator
MNPGPIIVIDDDADDKEIFESALKELAIENKRRWFTNCKDAFDYLRTINEQPFIIFCDVNIPGLAGIEFKRQIDEYPSLRKKSIPFIFYSTAVDQSTVNKAYTQMTVQGFFQKKDRYEEVKRDIKLILEYWKECRHPNTK